MHTSKDADLILGTGGAADVPFSPLTGFLPAEGEVLQATAAKVLHHVYRGQSTHSHSCSKCS